MQTIGQINSFLLIHEKTHTHHIVKADGQLLALGLIAWEGKNNDRRLIAAEDFHEMIFAHNLLQPLAHLTRSVQLNKSEIYKQKNKKQNNK
jgi:hypothetical protein